MGRSGGVLKYMLAIWTLRAILVRFQMEMRNMLLDSREKVILVRKRQRTWLSCVHVLVSLEGRAWE